MPSGGREGYGDDRYHYWRKKSPWPCPSFPRDQETADWIFTCMYLHIRTARRWNILCLIYMMEHIISSFWAFSLSREIYYFRIWILPLSLDFKSGPCSTDMGCSDPRVYIYIHMTRMSNTHWIFGPTRGLSLLWRRINLLLSWGSLNWVYFTGCTLEPILVGIALREDHTSGNLVMSYAQLSGHCHFILAGNGYDCWYKSLLYAQHGWI